MRRIIDFHSHMLPGIDDGSRDADMSVSMLRAASAQGVEVQVLTPHFYRWKENIPSFVQRRRDSAQRLAGCLPQDAPRILIGSETAFFPHMSETDLSDLCIEGTKVLLVEMPFESWRGSVADEIATLSLDRGYQVVLAHVERFLSYRGNPEMLESLSRLPIHMQSNAEVFLHFSTRGRALKLLRSGMVTILGSDAHNLSDRSPNLGDARSFIRKRLGQDILDDIDETSSSLLKGAIEG